MQAAIQSCSHPPAEEVPAAKSVRQTDVSLTYYHLLTLSPTHLDTPSSTFEPTWLDRIDYSVVAKT